MARWLKPRSAPAKVAVQVMVLLAGAGVVYLIVIWLGSGLVSASP